LERGRINRIDLENTREDIIRFGLQLFDIFSNIDTLRIFLYAYDGIRSSKRAMEELGLTPKRYYSRLRELVEMGVLKKGEGGYEYTPLGKALYQLGYYLLDILKNREKLKLIGELMRSDILRPKEAEQILDIISGKSEGLELVLRSLYIKGRSDIRKITDYEKLVNYLREDIESAHDFIYLASRYIDTRIIETGIVALERGVDIKVLLSKEEGLTNKLTKLKLLLSPIILKKLLEMLSCGIEINKLVKEFEFSYSFCVIDDEITYFEFPSIIKGEFSIAFRVKDTNISLKFKDHFNKLWNRATNINFL